LTDIVCVEVGGEGYSVVWIGSIAWASSTCKAWCTMHHGRNRGGKQKT